MSECKIDGCNSPARSKGMCQKHYMRERRHGDPGTVGKAGRPTDWDRTVIREYCPELSERSVGKYKAGLTRLEFVFGDKHGEVMKLVGNRRANQYRRNVSAFEEEARALHAIHLAKIGKWPFETPTADEYLAAIANHQPHLVAIYSKYAPMPQ